MTNPDEYRSHYHVSDGKQSLAYEVYCGFDIIEEEQKLLGKGTFSFDPSELGSSSAPAEVYDVIEVTAGPPHIRTVNSFRVGRNLGIEDSDKALDIMFKFSPAPASTIRLRSLLQPTIWQLSPIHYSKMTDQKAGSRFWEYGFGSPTRQFFEIEEEPKLLTQGDTYIFRVSNPLDPDLHDLKFTGPKSASETESYTHKERLVWPAEPGSYEFTQSLEGHTKTQTIHVPGIEDLTVTGSDTIVSPGSTVDVSFTKIPGTLDNDRISWSVSGQGRMLSTDGSSADVRFDTPGVYKVTAKVPGQSDSVKIVVPGVEIDRPQVNPEDDLIVKPTPSSANISGDVTITSYADGAEHDIYVDTDVSPGGFNVSDGQLDFDTFVKDIDYIQAKYAVKDPSTVTVESDTLTLRSFTNMRFINADITEDTIEVAGTHDGLFREDTAVLRMKLFGDSNGTPFKYEVFRDTWFPEFDRRSDSFHIEDFPTGAVFDTLLASWEMLDETGDSVLLMDTAVVDTGLKFRVLNDHWHSQYNTPSETQCIGADKPAYFVEPDGDWSNSGEFELKSDFMMKVNLNGNGKSMPRSSPDQKLGRIIPESFFVTRKDTGDRDGDGDSDPALTSDGEFIMLNSRGDPSDDTALPSRTPEITPLYCSEADDSITCNQFGESEANAFGAENEGRPASPEKLVSCNGVADSIPASVGVLSDSTVAIPSTGNVAVHDRLECGDKVFIDHPDTPTVKWATDFCPVCENGVANSSNTSAGVPGYQLDNYTITNKCDTSVTDFSSSPVPTLKMCREDEDC